MVTTGRGRQTPSLFNRRVFIAAACAAAIRTCPAVAAGSGLAAPQSPRFAAVDWAMAETALALGTPPAAIAELAGFRRGAALTVPAGIVDLGLRGSPNLEALALVAPDLILSSTYYAFAEPQLRRIAPVFSRDLFAPGRPSFPRLRALLPDLANMLGVPQRGVAALAAADAEFAALAARIQPGAVSAEARRPCLLLEIGDARHVRIFGDDSLFDGALRAIGLQNAWSAGTQFAFAAPVPIERLIDFPEARFLIIDAVPAQAERSLRNGALWNSLAAVRAGRVHRLGEIDGFGGIPSALRFGRALVAALEGAS